MIPSFYVSRSAYPAQNRSPGSPFTFVITCFCIVQKLRRQCIAYCTLSKLLHRFDVHRRCKIYYRLFFCIPCLNQSKPTLKTLVRPCINKTIIKTQNYGSPQCPISPTSLPQTKSHFHLRLRRRHFLRSFCSNYVFLRLSPISRPVYQQHHVPSF